MTHLTHIPLHPGLLHQAYAILDIREENYRTRTFLLDRPLAADPGQFAMAWLDEDVEIPFSISGDDPLMLTATAVGPASQLVRDFKVGDKLWARGPIGHGFRPHGKHMVLAGGGFDVAPLLFLARRVRQNGAEVDVCLAARSAKEILMADAFATAGARVQIATEDGSLGEQGTVLQLLERLLQNPERHPDGGVYGSGPVRMMEEIDNLCKQYRVPRQLSWEVAMRKGRCAMGMCGACEISLPDSDNDPDRAAWLVCFDGPVSESE